MKPFFTLFVSCIIISSRLFAQGNKSVFLEFGGNGLGISVNYDARFTKVEKGLGFRAGIGLFPGVRIGNDTSALFAWPTIFTIPVGLNYLAGKAPHYFEAGLGATYFYAKGNFAFFFLEGEDKLSTFMFIPSAGYRFAKTGKSFQGRAFISPYINSNGATFFAGVSVGFKF